MSNTVTLTGEFRHLIELIRSLGLSQEQQASVLEAYQSELEHVRRLRVEAGTQETGLGPAPGARILPLREAERRHLVAALRHTGGKIYGRDGAAKLLDLKPTTLQSKLKKHGINRLDAAGEDEGVDAPSHATAANEAAPPSQRAAE